MTDDVPLYSSAVVGYRSWRHVGRRLGALSTLEVWTPGTNTALCSLPFRFGGYAGEERPHCGVPSPAPGCSCGIHAYHSRDRPMGPIVGAVIGWGVMEIHRDGWRAQHAAITALLVGNQVVDEIGYSFGHASAKDVWELAARYGVPVAGSREELEELTLRHGQPLPRHAVPTGTSFAARTGERYGP